MKDNGQRKMSFNLSRTRMPDLQTGALTIVSSRTHLLSRYTYLFRFTTVNKYESAGAGCYPPGRALGMEDDRIPDTELSASTKHGETWGPPMARLNGASAWVASYYATPGTNWLQISLGSEYVITGIITQGLPGEAQWVTSYRVSYGSILEDLYNVLVYRDEIKARMYSFNK